MNSPVFVTCAVIFYQGKILAAKRSSTMSNPSKWEFPGGKTREGETHEQCIIREIKEELGIDITILGRLESVFHEYPFKKIELIPFWVELSSFEFKLAEHDCIGWFDAGQLLSLDWSDADVKVVRQVLAFVGIDFTIHFDR